MNVGSHELLGRKEPQVIRNLIDVTLRTGPNGITRWNQVGDEVL